MPRKYKSPIHMAHIGRLVDELRQGEARLVGARELAERIEEAARQDQHDLYHDAEFHDGCEYCDEEREQYG